MEAATQTHDSRNPHAAQDHGSALVVDGLRDALMSGRSFANAAMSARSCLGYMPPISRDQWSHAMNVVAQMANESDPLAQVASRIMGKLNLYATRAQAEAALYEAAGDALRAGYTDTIRLASPEPGRRRDAQRDYTLRERAAIDCWLEMACRPFSSGVSGRGWAMEVLLDALRVRPPHESVAGRWARKAAV